MKQRPPKPLRPEPLRSCTRCPRLADFLRVQRERHPEWFNAPVPSFGPENARLLIVGLAPGLQGANRTGRPFTGDYAGDLLYGTLIRYGFARGHYDARPDDGLELTDCMITNAVRCVPPENKPTGAEIKTCQDYLTARLATLPRLQVILALGRVAHESVIGTLNARRAAHAFAHCAEHHLTHEARDVILVDSYHCSRYNTNTGRLTETMFHAVFDSIRERLNKQAA